jgi:ligand-binding sensor domain-containing protein
MATLLPKKIFRVCVLLMAVSCLSMDLMLAQNNIANLKSHLKDYAVNHIYPDQKGFLWVATDKGVVRYDGSAVKNYVHDPANPHSLAGNYVNFILPDKEGRLWFATGNAGLSCFDPRLPENQAFTNYRADIDNPEALISNELYTMAMDETGAIWVGGNETHLVRFDPRTGKCQRFMDNVTSASSTFYAICYLGNGQLFIEDRGKGFVMFDTRQNKVIQRWSLKDQLPKSANEVFNSVTGFAFDARRNVLWMTAYQSGLLGYDLTTKKILPGFNFNLPVLPLSILPYAEWQYPIALHLAPDGNIWVAYRRDHVFVYNPDTKQVLRDVAVESPTIQRMMPLEFKKIQYDTATQLTWIITTKGLFSYNQQTNPLTQFTPLRNPFRTFPQAHVQTDDGLLWMKDGKQLFALNPYTGQRQKQYDLPPNLGNIVAIKTFSSNVFLRGTNALWMFDKHKQQFRKLKTAVDATDILPDTLSNGLPVVWLATYGKGLYRFSQNFEKIDSFYAGLKIINLQLDAHKNLWLCTDGQGAWRMADKMNGAYRAFQNDPSVPKGTLPENVMIRAYSDKKGRLWLGSMSDGLVRVDSPDSEQPLFRPFPLTPVGSPSVMDFREDADGRLWISGSDNKLYLFNPETLESLVLNPGDDILPDIDLANLSLIQGQKGIWAMTLSGIRLLDDSRAGFNNQKLKVQFLDFDIFERNASERLLQPEINLSPKENYFTVSFSASDFENPSRIHYYYKLDEVNQDWINAGTRPEANYTNLDGGTYTFRARAVYGEGDLRDAAESTLKIVVAPHFWKTWWFRSLIACMLAAIAYTIFKVKINAVRHEAEMKTEFNSRLAEVRFSALRAQMNPHFIFNCMNTVEGFILENKKWEASAFLQKFSKLIRLVLENAQYRVIPIEQDMEALRMYIDLEKVRSGDNFDVAIKVDDSLLDFLIPPMLLQPYVENAIMHGLRHRDTKGGHLTISITQKDARHVECLVEDNGIGRANATSLNARAGNLSKTSLGLKITEERLSIFSPGAVLTTEDVCPGERYTGTRVRILMEG